MLTTVVLMQMLDTRIILEATMTLEVTMKTIMIVNTMLIEKLKGMLIGVSQVSSTILVTKLLLILLISRRKVLVKKKIFNILVISTKDTLTSPNSLMF